MLHAGRLLKDKPEIEPAELIAEIEAAVPKSRLSFIPGNLDFLRAGGRVSNAAYISGSLLKIKPLIEMIDGKLVSTKKYRGQMNKVSVKWLKKRDSGISGGLRLEPSFLHTPVPALSELPV